MEVIIAVATGVGAAGTIMAACATFWIARLTAKTIKAYDLQVQVGREQVAAIEKQTMNHLRPILQPPIDVSNLIKTEEGRTFMPTGSSSSTMSGLKNVGLGPASNIFGLIFGTPFHGTPPHEHYSIWNYGILPPGTIGNDIRLSQSGHVKSTSTINGNVLYAPVDAGHVGYVFRLSLTYHDVFGRKFASMYDYQSILGWICIGNFDNIEQDLYEMEAEVPLVKHIKEYQDNVRKWHDDHP